MAKEKKQEAKVVLEREYIIPLRREFLKVPRYRRANKSIKAIKEFLARHMKLYDRELGKIKLDKYLNEEIWFRGIKHPPAKIKIKAKKFDDNTVRAELAEIPQVVRYRIEREKRQKERIEKPAEKKEEKEELEKKIEETEKTKEGKAEKEKEKREEKEKEKSTVIAGLKEAKDFHKEMKHIQTGQKIKKQPLKRMALQK